MILQSFIFLNLQQNSLCLQASCITGQRTVAAYDAMARDEDADAVGPYCSCHSSYSIWTTYAGSYLAVTHGSSIWDIEQGIPYQ